MVVLSLGEDAAPRKEGLKASKEAPRNVRHRSASRKGSGARSQTPKKAAKEDPATEEKRKADPVKEERKAEKKAEKKAKSSRHSSLGRRSTEDKENKAKKEEKIVHQSQNNQSILLSSQKGESMENPEGAKIARAALLELSQAFQTGNETAAMQALGKLMRNRQGLDNLSALPGFDEKTTRYLQQALSVMASEPTTARLLNALHPMEEVTVKDGVVPGVPITLPGVEPYGVAAEAPTVRFPPEEQRRMVANDWKRIQQRSKSLKKTAAAATVDANKEASVAKSSFWKLRGSSSTKTKEVPEEDIDDKDLNKFSAKSAAMDFTELFVMNAGIIGANMSYMQILLSFFEQLLAPVVNGQPNEAEVAADIVALRFFREAQGEVQLKDFKTSMLASARALVPETWDTTHEAAWIAVWDCITEQLEKAMPLPRRYAVPVQRFVTGLSLEQRKQLGIKSFDRFFKESPEVSLFFKQSNTRLAFIIGKALDFAVRLFQEPAMMVDEMTALGLKHIMYQAQPKFFHPWVAALVAEIQLICKDEEVVQGMNYAMCIIGSIIGQAVETGSTPVLQAVVNDDVKALKRALQATPRAERFEAALGR